MLTAATKNPAVMRRAPIHLSRKTVVSVTCDDDGDENYWDEKQPGLDYYTDEEEKDDVEEESESE
jgi:hypothetical protein